MPVFEYKAITESGQTLVGQEVAASKSALAQQFQNKGMFLQSARPVRIRLSKIHRSKVGTDEFLLFNQEFIALLKAGLTIPESLELVARGHDDSKLRQTLAKLKTEVTEGQALSDACKHYPEIFPPLYITTLRIGEKSGTLKEVLAHYQKTLSQQAHIRGIVKQAMIYPLFLFITLVAIMTILFVFVLPRFVQLYTDIGATLPLPTQIIVNLVETMAWWLPAAIGTFIVGFLIWRSWLKAPSGRLKWDGLKFKIPVIGSILKQYAQVHLVRSLAMLLQSGTPLLDALTTIGSSFTNRFFAHSIEASAQLLSSGTNLAQSMKQQHILPDSALKMIEVGEASGALADMLLEIASYFDNLLETRLNRMATLIEPIMMLIMGVMIGGTIIIMYLPIFYMAEVVG